ncbi:recombination protein F [Catenovulum agarivorans DS-2]|uniref:DNA replication and repair protein RecF n=1 Tax=Catenovulum agarivorans DS-2 TaxID=1328313 RepID=W7QJX7_9ALTE|nr:DNA replication/repair protein RecF [Catenovulum agarivorans]EWH09267.1 recombination protein F [Catenovulum agarivorans DS-2]
MHISKLAIHSVRNISNIEISPHAHCNIIVGENGSGKSSLLEAIHLLGFGRSFRKSKTPELIQFGQDKLTVFADCIANVQVEHLQKLKFGLSKSQSGDSDVRIQGKKAARLSELSSQFPIVAFTCDSFDLVDGSPSVRRKFLDWLVFHVKHQENVASIYRDYARVLEQRNSALRRGLVEQIRSWNNSFVQLNLQIQQLRSEAVEWLNQAVKNYVDLVNQNRQSQAQISLEYKVGWNQQVDLAELLEKNFQNDLKRKTTSVGVHRDELILKFAADPIKNILSRGECKRYVLSLMFAAEDVIKNHTDKNCIWIVDDIAAELDLNSIRAAFSTNKNNQNQMFFTCIEKDLQLIQQVIDYEHAVFHVKHGKLIN